MYSLKTIQEANYKLNEPNPLDVAVGDALKTSSFIKRRKQKLGEIVDEEPKKKTRRGKGRGKSRGRSKPNNNAHVDAKEKHDPDIGVRARAKLNKDGAAGDTPKNLSFIKQRNAKLNDKDGAVGDTPKNLSFIKQRNAKLNAAAGDTPKIPAYIRRKNEKLGLGAAEEPKKKTGRSKYKPNKDGAVGNAPKNPPFIKQRNEKLNAAVGDTPKTPAFIRRRNEKLNGAVGDTPKTPAFIRRRNEKLNGAVGDMPKNPSFIKQRNEKLGAAEEPNKKFKPGRFKPKKDNNSHVDTKAKHDIDKAEAALATSIITSRINRKIKENKERKAAINAEAHVSARKKHLENKAKTSKQRKNRGAIAAAGLAAAGGLIHQNSDAIKSAYDAI